MTDKSIATPAKSSLSIILATTSPFKQALFERLGLPFTLVDPQIDETPLPLENAPALAIRLAKEKAIAGRALMLSQENDNCSNDTMAGSAIPSGTAASGIVIGCDQAPVTQDGEILHKPGTRERAASQLMALRGQCVSFHTAVYTLAFGEAAETFTKSHKQAEQALTTPGMGYTDLTTVHYRDEVTPEAIDRYLEKEAAWRCAGAVQSESLGITLLSKIESQDPTALIGLPLIGLTTLLLKMGVKLP